MPCCRYEGEIQNGMPNGHGKIAYHSESQSGHFGYEGSFKNGLRQGSGRYSYYEKDMLIF